MAPLFLDLDEVLRVHQSLIEHYGGEPGVGVDLEADEPGLVDITVRVACGQAGKTEIAAFFRQHKV